MKVTNIDKFLAELTKRKGKTQINKIGNEDRAITTDTTENERIISNYVENLYSDKLEEIEKLQSSKRNGKNHNHIHSTKTDPRIYTQSEQSSF